MGSLKGADLLTHKISNAMLAASAMLLLALILAFVLIVRPKMKADTTLNAACN